MSLTTQSYEIKHEKTGIQETNLPFNENGNRHKYSCKRRSIQTAFTKNQLLELEREFNSSKSVHVLSRFKIGSRLNLNDKHVNVWFQNRGSKNKKIDSDKIIIKPSSPYQKKKMAKNLLTNLLNQNSNRKQKDYQSSNQVQKEEQITRLPATVHHMNPPSTKFSTIMPYLTKFSQEEQQTYLFLQSQRLYHTSQQYSPRTGHEHQYYPSYQQSLQIEQPDVYQYPSEQYQQFKLHTFELFSANLQQHKLKLQPTVQELSVEPVLNKVPVATSEMRNHFLNFKKSKQETIKEEDDNQSADVSISKVMDKIKEGNLFQDESSTGDSIIVFDDNFDIAAFRELRRIIKTNL